MGLLITKDGNRKWILLTLMGLYTGDVYLSETEDNGELEIYFIELSCTSYLSLQMNPCSSSYQKQWGYVDPVSYLKRYL